MSLLEFSGLRFGYSDEIVVLEAAGALHSGNVVGLVGVNGGGKTTLLRLLSGELQPDSGNLQRSRSTRIALVAQAAEGDMDTPLYDYVQGGRPELIELEHQIARLSDELSLPQNAAGPAHEALLQRLGRAQDELDARGGHGWEHMVERLLLGLAFRPGQFSRPIGRMSGGQLQKARLARQLLSVANCLILDEPTNHLDLDSQAFLVDWLRALTGRGGGAGLPSARGDCAVLLVSHDRWLLDALCDHIWELEAGVLYRYPGNYSKYLPQREARRRLAREQYESQREQIARTEEYIRRNIAGQNTKQAQGRRTHLQRMERLEAPSSDPQLSFILKPALRTGEQVLVVEDLAFAYEKRSDAPDETLTESPDSRVPGPESEGPETRAGADSRVEEPTASRPQDSGQPARTSLALNPTLDYVRSQPHSRSGILAISALNFQVMRCERLGIVGPNGCGKTTLLKLITRQLPPLQGMVAWGSNVELGVFSQDSADLGRGLNLISELRSADPLITDSAAREYLARFGFSGDDVMKDVAGLSGGERSRLSLAKLFRRRPNVLVFDEPTNHLDIYAREAIEQFLSSYEGTIIMVTHDRALLERLCDRLLVFERAPAGADPASAPAPGGPVLGDSSMTTIDGRTQGPPLQAELPAFSQHYFRGHYSEYLKWKEQSSAGSRPAALEPGSGTGQPLQTEDSRGQAPPQPGRSSGAAMPARRAEAGTGLPSPEQLAELARAERCSPPQYCRKQLQRLEKRGMEMEALIEAGEEAIAELEAQQRSADAGGEYTKIASLQEQIDARRRELDGLYSELEQNMSSIEAWAELEVLAG
ncbi:ABC-F family ATP-binding cassette domain-containing protein [bacterium]|nr:ABC-F family ATP-binding cassette domain-containing protein [bacterium]